MSKQYFMHSLFRALSVLVVIGMAFSAFSGTASALPRGPEREPVSLAELEGFYGPLSQMEGEIGIVIEFESEPGAAVYARGLAFSPARAAQAGAEQVSMIKKEQNQFMSAVRAKGVQYTEMYRTQRAYNGVWMNVDVKDVKTLAAMPGVKAIHRIIPKELDHTTSVPLIGALQAWAGTTEYQGDGMTIGIIDSGIDYIHTNFGGPGDYTGQDFTVLGDEPNDALTPAGKVVGGWDFAGDAYAYPNAPSPDPDPMDCGGHGSHVAGSAAGLGVLADGSTFTGDYATLAALSANDYQNMFHIGPGVAPMAKLYSLRVFGCGGSTALTDLAIDWAMDPNNDGDMSDHLDVINMSLGSSYGSEYDTSAIAANNAADAGVIVVASAGNSGDVFYITGSPGLANNVISVAASMDSSAMGNSVEVTASSNNAILGLYPISIPTGFGAQTFDVSGELVLSVPANGCGGTLASPLPFTNAADVAGKIAVVDRGTCAFVDKARNAQASGAIGVIIANNVAGFPPGMAGTEPTITIPSVSTSLDAGNIWKGVLDDPGTVTVHLDSAAPLVLAVDASFNDVTTSFTSRGIARSNMLKPDVSAPGDTIYSTAVGTGSDGASFNGTSMAAPHVAGVMALLKQANPTWSVAELKALVMNTATNDLFTSTSKTIRNSPSRVGAGRVSIPNALNSPVVAFDADNPGGVSLSFGVVPVVSTKTIRKTVTVKNTSASDITYNLSFVERYNTNAGVTFAITDLSNAPITSILVPANSTADFRLSVSLNAATMTKTLDPSLATSGVGITGRQRMSESGGFILLESTGSEPDLRLPAHIAARPASSMAVTDSNISLPAATTGTFALNVDGIGVPSYGGLYSMASVFELMEESPNDTFSAASNNAADLKYVGAAYDSVGDYIYFGIATHGKWNTPNAYGGPEFDVYIDVDEDGTDDYLILNVDSGFGTTTRTDLLYMVLIDLATDEIVTAWHLNDYSGSSDTNVFNNDVLVLPVPATATALGLDVDNPDFNFQIYTFNREGAGLIDATEVHSYNIMEQAFELQSQNMYGPFEYDGPIGTFNIAYNKNVITERGTKGLLVLHHYNAANTAQVIGLESLEVLYITRTTGEFVTTPSVEFAVEFSKPATGVDETDFTLTTGTQLSGATIASVSGSGTSYLVTVDGYTGNGMLRLDVPSSASIEAVDGAPLTGSFTEGEAYIIPASMSFFSNPSQDGWIMEHNEAANVGNLLSATGALRLGDGPQDEQYRSIVAFNTSGLPDNAIVAFADLKIKRSSMTGYNNPFTWGGALRVDACRGFFGTTAALVSSDWEFNSAAKCTGNAGLFSSTPVSGVYTATIEAGLDRFNKTGPTQFRLRFTAHDNDDNSNDFMNFFDGTLANGANRPTLIVYYYQP